MRSKSNPIVPGMFKFKAHLDTSTTCPARLLATMQPWGMPYEQDYYRNDACKHNNFGPAWDGHDVVPWV